MGAKTGPMSARVASKYIVILRAGVTTALIVVAIAFAVMSYFTRMSYEHHLAVERFHSISHYGLDTLADDFGEKQSVVLGMAKNMAYFKPNISEWPNVAMPGFFDSSTSQRDSAGLDDIFFMPIVQPEELTSFETFMSSYFASEPEIGAGAGIPALGVFSMGPHGPYHDTTGQALVYNSPHNMTTPVIQQLYTMYATRANQGFNMHSTVEFGPAMDSMIACSRESNYSTAHKCVGISAVVGFPLGSSGADVKDFHTAILQPVYLSRNTSNLVGFMGGGFNWLTLLSKVLRDSIPGVEIVVCNCGECVTFVKSSSPVRFVGVGDLHDSRHNHLMHSVRLFAAPDGGEDHSTYTVYFYPNDEFYTFYQTKQPIHSAIVASLVLGSCAAVFFLYDYFVRGETAAHEAVLETKRRFVRFVSHEIRTPLNAVHLGLEALIAELRRTIESAGVSNASPIDIEDTLMGWLELVTEMTSNCDSAEDVLNDLLNYDKIEMGTLHLEFTSVVICDLVHANMAVFHTQVKQKNIELTVSNHFIDKLDGDVESQDTSMFVVVGDSARLAQVMRNLISNALKFTPNEGSIAVHVERVEEGLPYPTLEVPAESQELVQQQRAGSIRISVTDSGAGLSEAQLAKICSEGVQFNANELQAGKGSGLGLYITKGIVEQHGGKLTVTSGGIGAGTTFSVELPLFVLDERSALAKLRAVSSSTTAATHPALSPHRSHERLIAESIPPPPPLSGAPSVSSASVQAMPQATAKSSLEQPQPKRILVVDDASSNRKMLSRILTAKGYVCEQAEDGQQAIDVYRAAVESGQPFYAITMDFEMPVMNGPTATGHLRALGCAIPIIGVTGNMLPDDILHFKAQGATEVIGKPVSIIKFEELMKQFEGE